MDSLQTTVLALATVLLAISTLTILWHELGAGTETGFLQGWRDLLGLGVTLGGITVLLAWLWVSG